MESESQLEEAIKQSYSKPVLFFKHSTRCSISSMALNRLNSANDEICRDVECYFLDLLKFRNVSKLIEEKLSVYHESPQLVLVKSGDCVYDASHGDIHPKELAEQIANLV